VSFSIRTPRSSNASLCHLRDFKIDRVKIDRSFLADCAPGSASQIILKSMVELGHSLSKTVIVEGVETDIQAILLRDIGCEFGQGYFFGAPSAKQSAQELLNKEICF
jgi:EAL domain-containing protein (putative c-di-GMP-specific phosphodiesterase class I)